MKIGIVTLNGKHNYGNRLQNYALQVALAKLSVDVVTVTKPSQLSLIQNIKNMLKPILAYTPLYPNRSMYFMKKKKAQGFHAFDVKHVTERDLNQLDMNDIDIFIAGSDQVWNPKFAGTDFHFLFFAPKEKRVSYAASFGVSEIPEGKQEFYKKYLSEMRNISVREEAGVRIVKQLTGRDATLVPDPTILLTQDDWNKLVDEELSLADEKYLVIYSLHDLSTEAHTEIQQYASVNNLEIYQIMGDFYNPSHKIPDPAEFVARIKYAQAVFTDSFHACVFSIIMNTPFKVFDRTDAKMSSRIDTLLKTYRLEMASSDTDLDSSQYNFDRANKILETERKKGFDFLNKVISDSNTRKLPK